MVVMAKKDKSTGDRHKDRHMVSLPGVLYDRIKAIAEKYQRPLSWQVRLILEEALKREEQPPENESTG